VYVILSAKSCPPLLVGVNVSDETLSMEVDTGFTKPVNLCVRLFPKLDIVESNVILSSATGPIQVIGEVKVLVKVGEKEFNLQLVVCEGVQITSPLLGRPWLDAINPTWRSLLFPAVSVDVVKQVCPPNC
jgi:hypothetical protein